VRKKAIKWFMQMVVSVCAVFTAYALYVGDLPHNPKTPEIKMIEIILFGFCGIAWLFYSTMIFFKEMYEYRRIKYE